MKPTRLIRDASLGVAMLFCLWTVAGAARFSDSTGDVARVYAAIEARLALMPEVAAAKWLAQSPIYDEDREREILARMAARGRELGLDERSVRAIFTVQFQMARAVQGALFETWGERGFVDRQTGRDLASRDLNTDLRPELDALGQEQLEALYWARGALAQIAITDDIARSLRQISSLPGVTAQDLAELRDALHDLPATPAVDAIAQLRVLRVGTTGDYAPFSIEREGELRGADVELAEALAEHLRLKVRFVRTSWPTLMADVRDGRFDLALSGITNTPERAAQATFSTAYHFDGKTPIARCQDRDRFETLDDIDKSTVRIVVNPGGTNEAFVREHIRHARVIVHADNRTVFDEIVAERADVMITDAIEVELQTRRHKELCRTMSGTLTNTAKAILLPQGSPLLNDVDRWLQAEIARGAIREKLQRALHDAEGQRRSD